MPAVVDIEKCEGCGDCVESCPTECIKIEEGKAVVDQDECLDCGGCVDACPTDAITIE